MQLIEGLTEQTYQLIDPLSRLECIKGYTLVGGTALSVQIGTRLSEDLDFMLWADHKGQKMEVDWPTISKELSTIGDVESMDILDIDHVLFIVSGVNLSFYACIRKSPVTMPQRIINNIFAADKTAIGAMKMEVMLRRSRFRDYYDIYSLLKDGESLHDMIQLALKYSQHRLKTRNLLSMLTNSERFAEDRGFALLRPKYDVTPKQIEEYIKDLLLENPF